MTEWMPYLRIECKWRMDDTRKVEDEDVHNEAKCSKITVTWSAIDSQGVMPS